MSKRGIGYKYVRLFDGEPVPVETSRYTGIIILGGPMNVYEEDKYPYLKDEDILIKKEIGWYKLNLTEESRQDKVFNALPHELSVFQWHGDTFDIPEGAARLAGSELFPNQAYRIGSRIYGLQFHLEVTKEIINQWIAEYREELSTLDYINAGRIISNTPSYIDNLKRCASLFYDKFF